MKFCKWIAKSNKISRIFDKNFSTRLEFNNLSNLVCVSRTTNKNCTYTVLRIPKNYTKNVVICTLSKTISRNNDKFTIQLY